MHGRQSAARTKPLVALRPVPTGRCLGAVRGLEAVACSESGRWLYGDTPTSESRRCEHWAIDAVIAQAASWREVAADVAGEEVVTAAIGGERNVDFATENP